MSEDFIQRQINDLQKGQEELRGRVESALEGQQRLAGVVDRAEEKADKNNETLAALRNDLTFVKSQIITRDDMAEIIRQENNAQLARGVKYFLGLIAAAISVKFVDAMDWLKNL